MKPMDLSAYRESTLKTSMRWHREALPPAHCHSVSQGPLALLWADNAASHHLWLHPWPLQMF